MGVSGMTQKILGIRVGSRGILGSRGHWGDLENSGYEDGPHGFWVLGSGATQRLLGRREAQHGPG